MFGLSHKQVGLYACRLGDYCHTRKLPPLNGLIVSATKCVPSNGYNFYEEQFGKPWGEVLSECWRRLQVTSSREKQVQDFSGLDSDISGFLSNGASLAS